MLLELLPNTRYCMEVEIIMGYKIKNSLPSNITCEMNTASGECPVYKVPLIFFNVVYTLIHSMHLYTVIFKRKLHKYHTSCLNQITAGILSPT